MTTTETLKIEIINLLSVPSYKELRQIPYTHRNYKQNELQMEFDCKMQDIMDEWDKL